jgi:hypothetical protein
MQVKRCYYCGDHFTENTKNDCVKHEKEMCPTQAFNFKMDEAKYKNEETNKQARWQCCGQKVFTPTLSKDSKNFLVSMNPRCTNHTRKIAHENWSDWTLAETVNDTIDIPSSNRNVHKGDNTEYPQQEIFPTKKRDPRVKLQKKALIIANTYRNHQSLQDLPNCETDANNMKNILEKKEFNVQTSLNSNKRDMIFALRRFGDSLSSGDVALIYYSGHGISYDGFHCLLPNDYEGDESTVKDFSVTFVSMIEFIAKNNPAQKIFLFDCCRNRPFEKIKTYKGNDRMSFSGINSSEFGYNILIASSTAESTPALGNGKNGMSLWTSYLVEEIDKEDTHLEQSLKSVRKKIREEGHNQIPWESTSMEEKIYLS